MSNPVRTSFPNLRIVGFALLLCLAMPVSAIAAAEPPAPASAGVAAGITLNGEWAGSYHESTIVDHGRIDDTVTQVLVLNRLGSRVTVSTKNLYIQDAAGKIVAGRFEMSSSKSTTVTDLAVHGSELDLTMHSGGRAYSRRIPFSGNLLGPAGIRHLVTQAPTKGRTLHYRTFSPETGDIVAIELEFEGRKRVRSQSRIVSALEFEQQVEGRPGKTTLWLDASGYLVRAEQASPFGPIVIARGENVSAGKAGGATLPADSYQSTLAISNIRLPHPRRIQALTVAITKRADAYPGWPNFSWQNQKVLEKTPNRVVLHITQLEPQPDTGDAHAQPSDSEPDALIQSDDPQVIDVAKHVEAGRKNPWQTALSLQRWTHENMKPDMGIAIAPASELIRDRHGTCVGYAILLASLTRAVGIPSRVRLGYVYAGGAWVGHAWTEVLVRGQWLPLDAAEYYPGTADAARIGVITVSGQSGTIQHVGDLALLFGKVDIRILSYTLDGKRVTVARNAAGHHIQGDTYVNSWIGLRVTRPAGMKFSDLDARWPNSTVVTLASPGRSARILYAHANPNLPLKAQASTLLDTKPWAAKLEATSWNGTPAVRVSSAGKEAIVAADGDVLWAIVASGYDPNRLLAEIQHQTSISDLADH